MFKIVVLCILPLTTFELDYNDSVETEMRRYRRQTRPAGSDGAKPSSTSSIAGTVSPTTKLQPQPQDNPPFHPITTQSTYHFEQISFSRESWSPFL